MGTSQTTLFGRKHLTITGLRNVLVVKMRAVEGALVTTCHTTQKEATIVNDDRVTEVYDFVYSNIKDSAMVIRKGISIFKNKTTTVTNPLLGEIIE